MILDLLRGDRARLFVLLLGSALVFGWGLNVSGYANSYYSAAALAGSESWKAMFFGSLDPANAITVDKPPLALWPMAMSVRFFGLSSWSILLPQAVEGVASVGLLYACVRRATGVAWPALLAGVVFAVTPVVVLVFRYNNPDALLTLLLLGSAYATLRAVESERALWWLALAGALTGLGFLTKMLEAFLVVPAMAVTYAAHGRARPAARLRNLLAGGASLVMASGWWVTVVELWPTANRPFIGGSPTNSVVQLALGYNGVGRLTGSTGTTASGGGVGATNLARIGRTDLGAEITWLLPTAVLLGVLAWSLSRHHPRRTTLRPSLMLWTLWLAVASATFAAMVGIFHSYYTVVLAPGMAAMVGIGAWLAWERRSEPRIRRVLAWTVGATTILAAATVLLVGEGVRWTALPIVVGGALTVVRLHPRSGPPRLSTAACMAAVLTALAGPMVFSAETVRLPHVGSGPMAGPAGGASSGALMAPASAPPAGVLSSTALGPISRDVLATLNDDAEDYRWAAATLGAKTASAYELALDEPVLAIGGYKGTDPAPTLPEFQSLVRSGRVHWLITGGTTGSVGLAIQSWVAGQYPKVVVDGRILYDLSSVERSEAPRATAATA